jgi:hypothetical protein
MRSAAGHGVARLDNLAAAAAHCGRAHARPPPGPATRPEPRKCREFETDLGVIAVRQAGRPRSHMIDMSCAVRPYIQAAGLGYKFSMSEGEQAGR